MASVEYQVTYEDFGKWKARLDWLFSTLSMKLSTISADRMHPMAQLEKMGEEVAELHEAVESGSRRAVLKESADVIVTAVMTARACGVDFHDVIDEVERKMEVNVAREWAAHNGTARHTDELS